MSSLNQGKEVQCSKDRKSTRLNSSHLVISYAVFCLKKKKKKKKSTCLYPTFNSTLIFFTSITTYQQSNLIHRLTLNIYINSYHHKQSYNSKHTSDA